MGQGRIYGKCPDNSRFLKIYGKYPDNPLSKGNIRKKSNDLRVTLLSASIHGIQSKLSEVRVHPVCRTRPSLWIVHGGMRHLPFLFLLSYQQSLGARARRIDHRVHSEDNWQGAEQKDRASANQPAIRSNCRRNHPSIGT